MDSISVVNGVRRRRDFPLRTTPVRDVMYISISVGHEMLVGGCFVYKHSGVLK